MPRVCVVIPTCDRPGFLRGAVEAYLWARVGRAAAEPDPWQDLSTPLPV